MEKKISTYLWSSSRERLKKIKTRFLSDLDSYFTIDNWLEYLLDAVTFYGAEIENTWKQLKNYSHRGMPLGNEGFLKEIGRIFKRVFSLKFRKTTVWKT